MAGHGGSKVAVIAAVIANLAIAIIKFIAAAITGSSAMISEGIHSLVDTGNGGLKFYAPPNDARNALAPGEVVAQMNGSIAASVPVTAGDARLILRHPTLPAQGPGAGNFGYLDVIGSKLTSSVWLPPTGNARACFGSCGPRSPVIYFRENY